LGHTGGIALTDVNLHAKICEVMLRNGLYVAVERSMYWNVGIPGGWEQGLSKSMDNAMVSIWKEVNSSFDGFQK